MPTYFFHAADGAPVHDTHGADLAEDGMTRSEALRYAGELLRWEPGLLSEKHQLRVSVTDEVANLLFTVVTVVVDVPRPQRIARAEPANDQERTAMTQEVKPIRGRPVVVVGLLLGPALVGFGWWLASRLGERALADRTRDRLRPPTIGG